MKQGNKQVMGAGGNVASAYRIVRKGGKVKFDSGTYQHDELLKYIGKRVWIDFIGSSPFADGPIKVYNHEHHLYGWFVICEIRNSEEFILQTMQCVYS